MMEKKMETTVIVMGSTGYILGLYRGLYRGNGKENGKYYILKRVYIRMLGGNMRFSGLGFGTIRAYGLGLRVLQGLGYFVALGAQRTSATLRFRFEGASGLRVFCRFRCTKDLCYEVFANLRQI